MSAYEADNTPFGRALASYIASIRGPLDMPTAVNEVYLESAFRAGWAAAMQIDLTDPMLEPQVINVIGPDQVYAAYPLKVGKQAALKAIKKAQKDTNIGFSKLLEATQAFATAVAQWPEAEKKYVPHPATWFNRGSYDDDPAVWQKGKPVYQSQFSQSH